jgi:hypothetical protein
MSKLRSGTYIREPDGAQHVYHNVLTSWNFPLVALRDYRENRRDVPEIERWYVVHDKEELAELKDWLSGNLMAGEYISINSMEIE